MSSLLSCSISLCCLFMGAGTSVRQARSSLVTTSLEQLDQTVSPDGIGGGSNPSQGDVTKCSQKYATVKYERNELGKRRELKFVCEFGEGKKTAMFYMLNYHSCLFSVSGHAFSRTYSFFLSRSFWLGSRSFTLSALFTCYSFTSIWLCNFASFCEDYFTLT